MSAYLLSGHVVDYIDHRYECTRCGARLMSMMQFQTRECPGERPTPVEPVTAHDDTEALARIIRPHVFRGEGGGDAVLRQRTLRRTARAILASGWLAARDAAQRAEGERAALLSAADNLPGFGDAATNRQIAQWLRGRAGGIK